MEPNDLVTCSICKQRVVNTHALHVKMSRVGNVWLCVACTVAVERALDLDTLVSCAICHRRDEPLRHALRVELRDADDDEVWLCRLCRDDVFEAIVKDRDVERD